MSDSEPWKDTMLWAHSDLTIAVGRVWVAIGRAVSGDLGLKMETKGLTQICNAIQWQEKVEAECRRYG